MMPYEISMHSFRAKVVKYNDSGVSVVLLNIDGGEEITLPLMKLAGYPKENVEFVAIKGVHVNRRECMDEAKKGIYLFNSIKITGSNKLRDYIPYQLQYDIESIERDAIDGEIELNNYIV